MPLMPFDIVAYSFNADIYCPNCTLIQVVDLFTDEEYDRDAIPALNALYGIPSFEQELAVLADLLGIDRMDEASFDSGDFPKVVFRDSAEDQVFIGEPEFCGRCHDRIIEEDS